MRRGVDKNHAMLGTGHEKEASAYSKKEKLNPLEIAIKTYR